jgi:hypothetical protein
MGVGIIRDETLKRRDLNTSDTLGCGGKTYSKPSSGHTGGRRPGQTLQKPKDLSACDPEERGCGVCYVCLYQNKKRREPRVKNVTLKI